MEAFINQEVVYKNDGFRLTRTACEAIQEADKAGIIYNVGNVAWQQHVLLE